MKKPKGWRIEQLGWAVSSLESGISESGEEREPGPNEPAVLKVSAVTGKKFSPDQCKALADKLEGRSRTFVKGDRILVNRANGSAALVGSSVYVHEDYPNRFLPDKIWQLAANESNSTARFLHIITSTKRFKQQVLNESSGGTGMKNIGARRYLEIEVAFPPLPEQRKIADILTTWDEALTQLDALIEAQERRKKALMQQFLTGKKRFPAFSKKPWKKVRMSEVLQRVFRPIDWSAEMSLSLVSLRRRCGGLFRRPDVLGADYKTQDLHELHADDFLISKRQVAHGAWGLVTSEFAGCHVSKEYAILVNTAPEKLHMPFFAWLCQTPRMIRLSRVASTGVHIEKLIFDPVVFLRDSIRIPSDLEEQRQIAAILDTADQQLTLLRTQRTALDQQKRGLMQRLLTGKLRVK
jgi:type I restriction enzyme S subunit